MDTPSPSDSLATAPPTAPADPIRTAYAALILAFRARAMDDEAAGRSEAANRATRFHGAIVGIRDRWDTNQDSPVRTRKAGG